MLFWGRASPCLPLGGVQKDGGVMMDVEPEVDSWSMWLEIISSRTHTLTLTHAHT